MIRAVIFDIGGPIDLETQFEAAIDADIRAGLEREGITVSDEAYAAAEQRAVEVCAPSIYRSILWQFTRPDGALCRRVDDWLEERAAKRSFFELRPGISDVLESIHSQELKIGLAANQPLSVLQHLDEHGIGRYFENEGISGRHGFRKPDVRVFLQARTDLGVQAGECIMVGDRMDNDIVPAKLLGMRTVRVRTGRHRAQEPRSWDEIPDVEVEDAAGIGKAIELLLAEAR
jgi:putative hydrolase of the HAD superfamily